MQPNLEQAKELVLQGVPYAEAARQTGFQASIHLYNLLDKDPDIVEARANGTLKTRESGSRTKGPDYYAAKPHVRAVLEGGLTHTEAAAKFGVSQPLVSKHVKLAGGEARKGRPAKAEAPANANAAVPADDPEIDAIKALLAAYAARHQINYEQARNLLSSFSAQYQQQDKP